MKQAAGYLPPGIQGQPGWETITYHTLTFQKGKESLEIEVPLLSPEQVRDLGIRVKQNSRKFLKSFTVSQIIDILDQAAKKLLDRKSPHRQRAEELLPIITGYDQEIIRLGLTSYLKTFRKPQLQRFIAEDFDNPKLLDEFQPRPKGGFSKAVGPDLIAHIWAGNVPALPLWSLISGLLVKAGNIGKVSSGEPLFAGLFIQVLVEIEPKLAGCFAIVWWKGGDEKLERSLFSESDIVVGYGSNQSLTSLRDKIPITTRFLPFGHKLSFGMVSKTALDTRKAWETVHRAALDIIRYDQQGCYSPHFYFVQRGGSISPQEFARNIAYELECLEKRYPRRSLSLSESATQAAWKNREELSAFSDSMKEVIGTSNHNWSVIYEENLKEITPSCLNRVIRIINVGQLEEAVDYLEHYRDLLQSVGIAAAPEELYHLSDLLGRAGVTRITALGNMTSPEAGWHHDGRFNLLDLVNIVDIELAADEYAEKFASYVD